MSGTIFFSRRLASSLGKKFNGGRPQPPKLVQGNNVGTGKSLKIPNRNRPSAPKLVQGNNVGTGKLSVELTHQKDIGCILFDDCAVDDARLSPLASMMLACVQQSGCELSELDTVSYQYFTNNLHCILRKDTFSKESVQDQAMDIAELIGNYLAQRRENDTLNAKDVKLARLMYIVFKVAKNHEKTKKDNVFKDFIRTRRVWITEAAGSPFSEGARTSHKTRTAVTSYFKDFVMSLANDSKYSNILADKDAIVGVSAEVTVKNTSKNNAYAALSSQVACIRRSSSGDSDKFSKRGGAGAQVMFGDSSKPDLTLFEELREKAKTIQANPSLMGTERSHAKEAKNIFNRVTVVSNASISRLRDSILRAGLVDITVKKHPENQSLVQVSVRDWRKESTVSLLESSANQLISNIEKVKTEALIPFGNFAHLLVRVNNQSRSIEYVPEPPLLPNASKRGCFDVSAGGYTYVSPSGSSCVVPYNHYASLQHQIQTMSLEACTEGEPDAGGADSSGIVPDSGADVFGLPPSGDVNAVDVSAHASDGNLGQNDSGERYMTVDADQGTVALYKVIVREGVVDSVKCLLEDIDNKEDAQTDTIRRGMSSIQSTFERRIHQKKETITQYINDIEKKIECAQHDYIEYKGVAYLLEATSGIPISLENIKGGIDKILNEFYKEKDKFNKRLTSISTDSSTKSDQLFKDRLINLRKMETGLDNLVAHCLNWQGAVNTQCSNLLKEHNWPQLSDLITHNRHLLPRRVYEKWGDAKDGETYIISKDGAVTCDPPQMDVDQLKLYYAQTMGDIDRKRREIKMLQKNATMRMDKIFKEYVKQCLVDRCVFTQDADNVWKPIFDAMSGVGHIKQDVCHLSSGSNLRVRFEESLKKMHQHMSHYDNMLKSLEEMKRKLEISDIGPTVSEKSSNFHCYLNKLVNYSNSIQELNTKIANVQQVFENMYDSLQDDRTTWEAYSSQLLDIFKRDKGVFVREIDDFMETQSPSSSKGSRPAIVPTLDLGAVLQEHKTELKKEASCELITNFLRENEDINILLKNKREILKIVSSVQSDHKKVQQEIDTIKALHDNYIVVQRYVKTELRRVGELLLSSNQQDHVKDVLKGIINRITGSLSLSNEDLDEPSINNLFKQLEALIERLYAEIQNISFKKNILLKSIDEEKILLAELNQLLQEISFADQLFKTDIISQYDLYINILTKDFDLDFVEIPPKNLENLAMRISEANGILTSIADLTDQLDTARTTALTLTARTDDESGTARSPHDLTNARRDARSFQSSRSRSLKTSPKPEEVSLASESA